MVLLKKYSINPESIFNSGNSTNLAHKSVKAGIYTFGSTIFNFLINIVRTVVLARILSPEEFGIIGMVTVLIGFVTMFKDAGLSTATIQKEHITHQQISNLAWSNLLITVSIGILIIISSPFVAMFYNKPELTLVTIAFSASFFVEGFFIQHRALLQRKMRFDTLNLITIISNTVSVCISIIFALLGFSYWAIIIGQISATLFENASLYLFCQWKPAKYEKNQDTEGMFRFGINMIGSNIVNYFARNADNIIIGKFAGAFQLGLYDKAYQLFRLPTNNILSPIRNIVFPALSSIQNNREKYINYYRTIIALTSSFIFPVSAYFYFEADFIIPFVLGSQWVQAIPIFKLLAIGGIIQPITGQSGVVMLSMGFSKRYLYWQIFYSSCLIASFLIGIQQGVLGLAKAYAIAEFAMFIPSLIYNYRDTYIKPFHVLVELVYPCINCTITLIMVYFISLKFENILITHIGIGILFFTVYSLLTMLRKNFRKTIKDIISVLINKK